MKVSDLNHGRVPSAPGSREPDPQAVPALTGFDPSRDTYRVPWTPTEAMWNGLARQIIMWLDMEPKTPRALFNHLDRLGYEVPSWLRQEPEMQHLDHVPSKGTRAVLVYRAMLEASRREGMRHLTAMWDALARDSDGSGEAGETRSGSTEGDSADPKGIAQ